jgi:hypothetical protein
LRQRQTVGAGHVDVEQRHIKELTPKQLHRLGRVASLPATLRTPGALQSPSSVRRRERASASSSTINAISVIGAPLFGPETHRLSKRGLKLSLHVMQQAQAIPHVVQRHTRSTRAVLPLDR